jgi:hypothetical protein
MGHDNLMPAITLETTFKADFLSMRAPVIHLSHDSPVREAELMHGLGQNSCRILRGTWGELEEEAMPLTWSTCQSVSARNLRNFSLCEEVYRKELYERGHILVYLLR